MNALERKWVWNRLQIQPSPTKFEVCSKLQPLVTQFGLTLTENKICFPQPLCYQQRAIYVCACCEKLYEKSIRFSDIVYINNNGQKICVVLRTGHVFYFFNDCQYWYIYNALGYGNPHLITVWWWKFTGGFLLWWRKLFHNNPSSQNT